MAAPGGAALWFPHDEPEKLERFGRVSVSFTLNCFESATTHLARLNLGKRYPVQLQQDQRRDQMDPDLLVGKRCLPVQSSFLKRLCEMEKQMETRTEPRRT